MRKLESGSSISLKDMKDKGVEAYLKENPLPNKACITCPKAYYPEKGEALALLKQIPDNQRERVIELDLDYASLVDEDLPQIPVLFPKLQKVSVGFEVGVEALGQLVEALPALQSLGLRKLKMGFYLADEHIARLVKAAQQGALQKLNTLLVGQTKVSPDVLQSLFAALPKDNLKYLILAGITLDPHVPKMMDAFQPGGSLENLKYLGVREGITLSPENVNNLFREFTGDEVDLTNFFASDEELLEALDEAVSQGGLRNLIHLNLSHNKGLPAKPLAKFLGKLSEHGKLQKLELVDMDLQDEHLVALQEEVKAGRLQNLCSLNLYQNHQLTDEAVFVNTTGMAKLNHVTFPRLRRSTPYIPLPR